MEKKAHRLHVNLFHRKSQRNQEPAPTDREGEEDAVPPGEAKQSRMRLRSSVTKGDGSQKLYQITGEPLLVPQHAPSPSPSPLPLPWPLSPFLPLAWGPAAMATCCVCDGLGRGHCSRELNSLPVTVQLAFPVLISGSSPRRTTRWKLP